MEPVRPNLNWRDIIFTAYIIVTVFAAAFVAWAAYVDFTRADWVILNMTRYGIPQAWLFPLGTFKAAGALGLLIGIGLSPIGVAAALGLVLYFIGAMVTVVRSQQYSHLLYPAPFFLLAIASLMLRMATR